MEVSTLEQEPFRRDYAKYYSGYAEERVLIDPAWIHYFDAHDMSLKIRQLVEYSLEVTVPTKIAFIYPQFLESVNRLANLEVFLIYPHQVINKQPSNWDFGKRYEALRKLSESYEKFVSEKTMLTQQSSSGEISDTLLNRIQQGIFLFELNGIDIIQAAQVINCDYILTENPWLLEDANMIKTEFDIMIVDSKTLIENLQLMLRAYGVFMEVLNPGFSGLTGAIGLNFITFYAMENRDLINYEIWFDNIRKIRDNEKISAYGQAAFLHRFPFILYSYDLARHHINSSRRFPSESIPEESHRFLASYHINCFYIHIAGLLDNIAWLINYFFDLGFRETAKTRNHCTLSHERFITTLEKNNIELSSILCSEIFTKWLMSMTDIKRHPAIHRRPLFLSRLIEKETGKLISDGIIVTETSAGYSFTDLIISLPYDMEQLLSFMNKITNISWTIPNASHLT